MSAARESWDLVYSLAEEQDFQQVLNICSNDDLHGVDYMPVSFHRWLQEPGRLVFIARMNNGVVGLVSALLVDGGQTVIIQGLRVAVDFRGRGIAGALQRHLTDYIGCRFPQVSAVRLSRINPHLPQTLAEYRLIAKEVILALCCMAADLGPVVAELSSRLNPEADCSPHGPVTLSQQQAETLIMTDHVVSNLLPGKTIISGWEPLKPVEANLELLRSRGLTWIVDREFEPTAVSLCTRPYAVPCRRDALHFNINIFGNSLASACSVFLAQLEALQLKGYLIFYTHVDPAVAAGLHQICQNNSNMSFYQDNFEKLVLERDL